MNVYSQLIKARLEQAAADLTENVKGLFWQNTTSNRVKYYNGSTVKELVETDTTQTLSNKTLTSPTINSPSISTPVWSGDDQNFNDGQLSRFKAKITTIDTFPYTLLATDNGSTLSLNSGVAAAINLPNNLPVGFNIAIYQSGSGVITLTPSSGAILLNRKAHTKTAGQYSVSTLVVMANTGGASANYVLVGDTMA